MNLCIVAMPMDEHFLNYTTIPVRFNAIIDNEEWTFVTHETPKKELDRAGSYIKNYDLHLQIGGPYQRDDVDFWVKRLDKLEQNHMMRQINEELQLEDFIIPELLSSRTNPNRLEDYSRIPEQVVLKP